MSLLPPRTELGWTPYAWLLYTVPLLVALMQTPLDPLVRTGYAASYVIFLTLYFAGYWVCGARLVGVILGMSLLGVAYTFTPFKFYGASFFIYAAAMIPFIDRTRPRVLHLAVYLTVVALFALGTGQSAWFYLPSVFIAAVVGGLNFHYASQWIANAKIRMAHSEVERMAKMAERERIARDMI